MPLKSARVQYVKSIYMRSILSSHFLSSLILYGLRAIFEGEEIRYREAYLFNNKEKKLRSSPQGLREADLDGTEGLGRRESVLLDPQDGRPRRHPVKRNTDGKRNEKERERRRIKTGFGR